MTRARFTALLADTALLATLFFSPASVSAVRSSQQTTVDITAHGQICGPYSSECGEFSITFNPAGGTVTGSFYVDWPITYLDKDQKIGDEVAQGTLTGTFAGGDGGLVSGTVSTGQVSVTYFVECDGCIDSTESKVGTPWEGHLWADGTGNGWIGPADVLWNVTFSALDFQAGLAVPTPNMASAPTLEPLMGPTPTNTSSEDLQPLPAVDENLLDVVVGPSSEVVKSWPDLDTSIAQILDQDDAIIARDSLGNFYVIDNQGVKRPLSADMQSNLQMNNEFGLLQNANLLWASPAVQAFVAANGEGALDAITGSGGYQYYTIPIWLQQRQHMMVSTLCGAGSCSAYTTISILDSSMWFPQQAFASSEHSSVRGTINGGGDFIYFPQPAFGKLASPAMQQGARIHPYFGVKVQETANGAYIQMVQEGSPAEQAGLLVGDLVTTINGTAVNSQTTSAALIGQYSAGDRLEIGILRNGTAQTVQVTLASMLQPVIVTPSAEITVTDNTEFVIDIGLNGVTALIVLADVAHAREPVTGSEVDVPAGMAVIILTGYSIGDPFPFDTGDINAWWQSLESAGTVQVQPATGPDFLSSTTLLMIGLAIMSVVVVVVVIVSRKRGRRSNPPNSPR